MITEAKEKEIITMYKDSMSLQYISKTMRVSIPTINKVLNRHGLKELPECLKYKDKNYYDYIPSGVTKKQWLKQAKQRVAEIKAQEEPTIKMGLIDAVIYFHQKNKEWKWRNRQAL